MVESWKGILEKGLGSFHCSVHVPIIHKGNLLSITFSFNRHFLYMFDFYHSGCGTVFR